jgi:hypothetical protein
MITKTQFKEYSRCARYVALADYQQYSNEERIAGDLETKEMLSHYFEQDLDEEFVDASLEVLLPYYNKVETLAALTAKKVFPGKILHASSTFDQPYFERWGTNYQFSSYADIIVQGETHALIEVKASTTKKVADLSYSYKKTEYPMFERTGLIYQLLPAPTEEKLLEGYLNQKAHLFNRFHGLGRYLYDIAIQAWITEDQSMEYYLAFLNHHYVFDGTYEAGEAIYHPINGEDIINFIDVTSIVNEYMDMIRADVSLVEHYVDERNSNPVPIGHYCERNKTTQCPFFDTCWAHVPSKNSVLSYTRGHKGFGTPRKTPMDYINAGTPHMLDVPYNDLQNKRHQIQYNVLKDQSVYLNHDKMKLLVNQMIFPLYHLDFESFPCPLPRYHGEKPYTQSVFQFSLHVQPSMDDCDIEGNHIEYLANNDGDERFDLVKHLCESIGPMGSVVVWNASFEKRRIQELANLFPDYSSKLMDIHSRIFDLMNVVDTKTSFYEDQGYSKEEATLPNFVHEDMQGSYSIKKVLPVFTDLSYSDLVISNGSVAMITYAKLPLMTKDEKEKTRSELIAYCRQDTWAMVEITNGINELLNNA